MTKEDDPIDDWTKDLGNLNRKGGDNEVRKKVKEERREAVLPVQPTGGSDQGWGG
jgi:hypothetical protein